jgi:outer membrane protein, multidrug efflux system
MSQALAEGAFLRAGDANARMPVARWWEELGDPLLSALIDSAMKQAPAIEAATARIRQARSGIATARASLLPALSASTTYIYADLPNQAFGTGNGPTDFVTVGFDTQWEADLWGGKARQVERARAQAGAAEAELADALVSLSAEIARTYVTLRAREHSEILLAERHIHEERLLDIAIVRLEGGTGPGQQVASARQRMARSEAELAAVRAEIAVLRDALAVLSGRAPGDMDGLASADVPLPPSEMSIGDPAAMLARRPDVLSAERRLAAASAGIGVAEARRFPSVSLLGLIGIGGSGIDDVFDTSQLSAIAIPRLSWSFLDFGRAAAGVRGAEAVRDEALANYRGAILDAMQDAEASLSRFGAARIAFGRAIEARKQAGEISRLDSLRGQAGTISNAEVRETMIRRLDAQLAEVNSRASLTVAYIALAKSLGLGWMMEGAALEESAARGSIKSGGAAP